MKEVYELITESAGASFNRKRIFTTYMWKYYNLFLGAYEITNVSDEQKEFILRRFWSMGKLAAFIVEGTKPATENLATIDNYESGMIAFTDFAPVLYNIYDWPIVVNLIQTRGATFIPAKQINVNQDCVIGYAQKSKIPVKTIVEFYVSKIVDIEMTIRAQLKSHKIPFVMTTTPENEAKMKRLFDRINNDEDSLYLTADELGAIQALQLNPNYMIDRLYAYKQAVENELLTYLGIDNLGTMQKKEHFVVDEVNSNNDLINDFSDTFLDSMKEFFARIQKYLNYKIEISAKASPVASEHDKPKGENENDDDE